MNTSGHATPPVKSFQLVLASYIGQRDGMALELARDTGEQVAEVFQDDASKARAVTFYTDQPVPLAAIEWLLEQAARRL